MHQHPRITKRYLIFMLRTLIEYVVDGRAHFEGRREPPSPQWHKIEVERRDLRIPPVCAVGEPASNALISGLRLRSL